MRMRILNNILFIVTGVCFGVAFVDYQVHWNRFATMAIAMGTMALCTALITKEEK